MIMVSAFSVFHGFPHIAIVYFLPSIADGFVKRSRSRLAYSEEGGVPFDGQPGRGDFDGKSGPVIGNSRQAAEYPLPSFRRRASWFDNGALLACGAGVELQRQQQKPFSP